MTDLPFEMPVERLEGRLEAMPGPRERGIQVMEHRAIKGNLRLLGGRRTFSSARRSGESMIHADPG